MSSILTPETQKRVHGYVKNVSPFMSYPEPKTIEQPFVVSWFDDEDRKIKNTRLKIGISKAKAYVDYLKNLRKVDIEMKLVEPD